MGSHAFRFAVQSFSASSGDEWRERARRTEALGYSALHLADHFIGPGEAISQTNHPVQELAAVPAIAVAAEATTTLRVGCRVFCVDYRQPAMFIKEAATLDLLSGGRLELGLGAGWLQAEYRAGNIPFDPPAVRIARLAEVVRAIKALMGDGPVDLAGEHVVLSGFEGAPKPVQRPHPPIMIGGGGKRVLTLAGREADIVSLNFNNRAGVLGPDGLQNSTAAETARKIGWVRDAAGARDPELEIGAYFTFVTDRPTDLAAAIGGAMGLGVDEFIDHPHALVGPVEALIDRLQERRERYGITYVTVPDTAMELFAPVVARLAGTGAV